MIFYINVQFGSAILRPRIVSRYNIFLKEHCVEYTVLLFKDIYYVSVLYRHDQIYLVKFLFTSSREYFILFRSFLCNTSPLFSLRSYLRMSAAGTQFSQFLFISIPPSFLSLSLSELLIAFTT